MSVTGVNDYYGKRLDPMTRTLSLEEVARLRELTQYVQDMYADNERPETWQNDLLATYSAAARTKRNTSETYTTTPPKRASSLTVVGEPHERHETMTGTVKQPNKLMMAGDWHGNLPWAFKAINYAKANGVDTILHVGDFGWWKAGQSTWRYLKEVDAELKHCGIQLYWVDGNHEDHSFWNTFNVPGAEPVPLSSYSSICHLPRGYRWEWWGDTWMALGGAYSVDRSFGTEGETWWHGETLDAEQVEYACRPGKVDIIVAHDAPAYVKVPGIVPGKAVWLNMGGKPRQVPGYALDEAQSHRDLLQMIVNKVKPVELYHGHYHKAYNALCSIAEGGYVNVRGLDKDETTMAANTWFITEGLDE